MVWHAVEKRILEVYGFWIESIVIDVRIWYSSCVGVGPWYLDGIRALSLLGKREDDHHTM
jgi:hypothetical protein